MIMHPGRRPQLPFGGRDRRSPRLGCWAWRDWTSRRTWSTSATSHSGSATCSRAATRPPRCRAAPTGEPTTCSGTSARCSTGGPGWSSTAPRVPRSTSNPSVRPTTPSSWRSTTHSSPRSSRPWPRQIRPRTPGPPGAQRLAVTSGGTIPDRGLFGVFLVGGEGPGRRVGELDEEMVYESRVGDVFALGATSWRIEDINQRGVLVTPAPGVPGRLPFWKGDALGRPAELGEAIGGFTRALASAKREVAVAAAEERGLDPWAADNLVGYVHEQVEATGVLPSDCTLVVERFRDELGDWRLVVPSPDGTPVHAPWALAINARLRERYGVDGQAIASDDGIVIRIPDTDAEPPTGDVIAFEPGEIDDLVTQEVGGSSLFASRFRECAARALLLPRRDPGRRSPL